MAISVRTGELELLYSNTIQTADMKPVTIEITDEGEPLRIEYIIARIPEEQANMKFVATTKDFLRVTAVNPNGLNFGCPPYKIGSLNKRELHVSFRANIMGADLSYELHYSFYLGKPVSDA